MTFPPDQVYLVMMEISPLWTHARPLGRSLYYALWDRMSDYWFARTEQGHFTWLVIALKQEVFVRYHTNKLHPMDGQAPTHSAILNSLNPIYDEPRGLVQWEAEFCLDNFEVRSVIGSVSCLTQMFSNPRPMPINYLSNKLC